MKTITGLSLVELMLALSLSVLLSSYFYKIYLSIDKNYNLMQGFIQIQATMRTLAIMLTNDIHARGLEACQSYVIKKTTRFNKDNTPVYALYQLQKNRHSVELAENVYQLTKRYDVDAQKNIIGVSMSYLIRGIESSSLLKKRGFIYVAIKNKQAIRHSVINGVGSDTNHVDGEPLSVADDNP